MKFISITRNVTYSHIQSSVWIGAHGVAETSRAFLSNVVVTVRCDAFTCWRFANLLILLLGAYEATSNTLCTSSMPIVDAHCPRLCLVPECARKGALGTNE